MSGTVAERASPRRRVRVGWIAAFLLAIHAALLCHSIQRNAITIDEVVHLPTGIAYWERGEFWGYHHNPPLVRLMFAIPAVIADVPMDYSRYRYAPHSRKADCDLGRDFMLLNRRHYMAIFVMCRLVVVGISVAGAYVAWRWSRELFGDTGGLLTLCLWTFSPNLLAHAGLVTPDVGSTVLGFICTYVFWKYLQSPSLSKAVLVGVLLGLTEASKYSFVILPPIWIILAVAKWRSDANTSHALSAKRGLLHGFVVLIVSLTVLNDVYLCEGTGRKLGSFKLFSRTLTKPDPAEAARYAERESRINMFRGTILERVPVPLPEQYILGIDDQLFDFDSGGYYKYLRGELRRGDGWWYYYLYCIVVKTPIGTLLILAFALVGALLWKGLRADGLSEATLLLSIVGFLAFVSSQTGLNCHLRYVLPIFPFLFVFAGRLGRMIPSSRVASAGVAVLLLANAVSVLRIHPHYLAYFNEPAGGPERALDHLADSNIDWGQGLFALKDWLDKNQNGRPLYLAYFGTTFPEIFGFEYRLPPLGPATHSERALQTIEPVSVGPIPGLHAVGANYLQGIPFPAPNASGDQSMIPLHGYSYYREFTPIATPGWSIYVYDISLADANRVRRKLGLPELPADFTPGNKRESDE